MGTTPPTHACAVRFMNFVQRLSSKRVRQIDHTGLGPGKSFEVNVPEPSGVARNGPIGLCPTTRKSSLHYNINSSLK